MKLGIVSRIDRKDAVDVAKEVIKYSKQKPRTEIIVEKTLGKRIGMKGVDLEKMRADIVIAVGGDGTMLRTLQRCNIPLLGIHVGTLGFLTEVPVGKIYESLEKILKRNFQIEKRIKLKVRLNKERLFDATNEVVLHTARIAKICHFKINVDRVSQEVRADGVIVATPTGSTSYAMSVGSPTINKNVNAFVIAPIAPFRLSARPMVISADSKIDISLAYKEKCILVIDGQYERNTDEKDIVHLSLSEKQAQFVRLK